MTTAEVAVTGTSHLEQLDPAAREVAVTTYLAQARDQLAVAVQMTGPAAVAALKAEIATAAEATKQLGLSKEIQQDAQEMVRRAEYAVRKAATAGQATGDVRSRDTNLNQGPAPRSAGTSTSGDARVEKPSARSFFASESEYRDANAMGALDESQFEDALSAAKDEDNLSRSNVAEHARRLAGQVSGQRRKPPRKPILEVAKTRGFALRQAMDSVINLTSDDRYHSNEKQVADALRGHLLYVAETVAAVLDQLP